MPTVYLFNYPDTGTEPVDYFKLIETNYNANNAPSNEQIQKLNDCRSTMASLLVSQPNTKAILNAIDAYIPELINILPYIEHNKLQKLIKFKWRSSLSASIRTTLSGSFEKPIVKNYSIYYEIIYVQMTYAFILSNMASRRVSSDSSDDALNSAINDLSRASGIFQSLSVTYASTWASQGIPPETTSESLAALADLALGDAQQLACMKAEKKGVSPGLLMKLKAGVVSKYDQCHKALIKKSDIYEEFSRHFKSHVSHLMKLYEGSLLLGMAKNHVEKDEYGVAVAEITAAHNMFVDCRDAENSHIKASARELMAETDILHTNYTKMNNSVMYQKVPSFDEIRNDYLSSCKILVDPKPVQFGKQQ